MATKQRLLAGNAEAARAGAARAEPGAWMASNAEKSARRKGAGKGKDGDKEPLGWNGSLKHFVDFLLAIFRYVSLSRLSLDFRIT